MRLPGTRIAIDRFGVEFSRSRDTIIWLWPWRRNGLPKFISVGLSGTGEFGDARFPTLESIDEAWVHLENAMSK